MITERQSIRIRVLEETVRQAAIEADRATRNYALRLAEFTDYVRRLETAAETSDE